MTRLLQIGPTGYEHATAATGLTYQPYSDRAAHVTGVRITKPSANDTWVISTSSKQVTQLQVDTVGNQQVTGAPSASSPANRDLYTWAEQVIGKPITYPVPNGQPFNIASVGGATADITIEFEECSINDVMDTELNHPMSKKFRMPIWAYLSTTISDTAEHAFDTQIAPLFVPPLFIGKQLQAGYSATIHAIWFEPGGRNTFNGGADHQSVTDHLYARVNGQRLFTRVPYTDAAGTVISADGIPAVGTASAAGSANSVYGGDLERFPAFQIFRDPIVPIISPGIHLEPGTTSEWGIAITGSATGGATFAHNYLLALCDVTVI